jgi:threonine/homoserine/homoserine lactone efflux protein
MPHADTLVLFMAAGLALNLTPGPDMLYVIARSSGEGRAAGIASALGIALGCLFHIAALAAGLSALLTRLPSAYHVIRIAGAIYNQATAIWLQRTTGLVFIALGMRLALVRVR